ncbi:MAG: hypothetical protein WCR59_06155, partial [Planctomycetota bacterium]
MLLADNCSSQNRILPSAALAWVIGFCTGTIKGGKPAGPPGFWARSAVSEHADTKMGIASRARQKMVTSIEAPYDQKK